jgi:hypothetical protein
MRIIKIRYLIVLAFALCRFSADAQEALPKGLILNLDFRNAAGGLIPNRGTFPLDVPLGDLEIGRGVDNRFILPFQQHETLEIPHSSLIEPDGSEWVVSARVYPLKDGILLSQCNDQHGYIIRIVDGTVQAALRTKHSTIILRENPASGLTRCLNRWITIELRIKTDMAYLMLNRKLAAMVPLDAPLQGENMYIRLGNHPALPGMLKNIRDWNPAGFTGGFASLKIFRQ